MKKHKKSREKQENTESFFFTFGEPEPVLSGNHTDMIDDCVYFDNTPYYPTPFSCIGLAKLLRCNPYHGPIIEFKTNLICRGYKPSFALSRRSLHAAVTDYNVFNNAYFQKFFNSYGELVRLAHVPAINTRRLKKTDRYCVIQGNNSYKAFRKNEILHIKNYDVNQGIYGVPYYLGAIQSMLLNEDATLFRRKYYKNGAHMGYILSTSGNLSDDDKKSIHKALEGSKAAGNFRNMYIHIPEGSNKENVKIHPVGDFSTRDELEKIKNLTRDDIIAAHRMPPVMASIMPQNTGGYGDLDKIDRIYKTNEIDPIRELFLDINNLLNNQSKIGFDTDLIL